jgi:uncharacterized protein (TIGR02246 family)
MMLALITYSKRGPLYNAFSTAIFRQATILPMKYERTGDDSAISSIAALRDAWLRAIGDSDVERLGNLVTDDVVVVHGNGRCVCGRDELKTDFRKGFERFSIKQNVSLPQVTIRGEWAFEIADVDTMLIPHQHGESVHVQSTTVVALSQQSDGSWKVGGVLGLIHSRP